MMSAILDAGSYRRPGEGTTPPSRCYVLKENAATRVSIHFTTRRGGDRGAFEERGRNQEEKWDMENRSFYNEILTEHKSGP